jgi:hypothetical protein
LQQSWGGSMNGVELIAEGEAIAKRCFLLSADGPGEVAGYWGGERSDMPDALSSRVSANFKSRRHIVTVSERLIDGIGVDGLGAVGLFEWVANDGRRTLRVEKSPQVTFDSISCDGVSLCARESTSFPPFEALCLYGSERVGDWLASQGLKRHEYWKVSADGVEEYAEAYREQWPVITGEADVVVGGWHAMWPEDDFYIPAEMNYLMLTLRDAEPWYSVWHSPMSQGCSAREHVT